MMRITHQVMTPSKRTDRAAAAGAAPLLVRHSRHGVPGALLLAVASLWLIAAVRGVVAGSPAVVPGLGASGAYWAGAIGAALGLLGLHWMVRRQTVAVDGDAVVVTERSLLGRRSWREPLAGYREIRGRIEQRPHRYGPRRWHVVELWHLDPTRRIELARARDPTALEALAREWACRCGLPLVWARPPGAGAAQGDVPTAQDLAPSEPPGGIAAQALSRRTLSPG